MVEDEAEQELIEIQGFPALLERLLEDAPDPRSARLAHGYTHEFFDFLAMYFIAKQRG